MTSVDDDDTEHDEHGDHVRARPSCPSPTAATQVVAAAAGGTVATVGLAVGEPGVGPSVGADVAVPDVAAVAVSGVAVGTGVVGILTTRTNDPEVSTASGPCRGCP